MSKTVNCWVMAAWIVAFIGMGALGDSTVASEPEPPPALQRRTTANSTNSATQTPSTDDGPWNDYQSAPTGGAGRRHPSQGLRAMDRWWERDIPVVEAPAGSEQWKARPDGWSGDSAAVAGSSPPNDWVPGEPVDYDPFASERLALAPPEGDPAILTCIRFLDGSEIESAPVLQPLLKRLREEGFEIPKKPQCTAMLLAGVIQVGDAERVEALTLANLPFMSQLYLNSVGGNLTEGMRIGRVARRYYVMTEAPWSWGPHLSASIGGDPAPPGSVCASACFFAWLGGVSRGGHLLGIHRPFPPVREMQRLSPRQADGLYRGLSETIGSYLREMGVSAHWLDDMMKIASDDVHMIPEEQVKAEFLGAAHELWGSDIPSLAQWKYSQCGALSRQESMDLYDFGIDRIMGRTQKNMEGYRSYLERRQADILACGRNAVVLARWKMRTATSR